MKIIPSFFKNVYTPEERRRRRIELILCILSGLVLGISFPPFKIPTFVFAGLIPYFFVISKRKGLAEINRATYLTAFIYTLVTLYWVGSWTKDADPFLMISGTMLIFFNPLLFLIPSTLFYFSRKHLPLKLSFVLLPFFWVSYEFMYSLTDLKFPWLTLGNSLPELTIFIQIADVIGVYGLSLIILFVNVLLFFIINDYRESRRINWKYCVITAYLVFIPVIYGLIKINNYDSGRDKVKVGLIQPDFYPTEKWDGGPLDKKLNVYLELSRQAIDSGAQIIIWPETALPVYLLSGSYQETRLSIRKFVKENGIDLLTGMPDATFYFNPEEAPPEAKPTSSGRSKYVSYNSVLHYSPEKEGIEKYGKINLVPFGEKAPFIEYFPWIGDVILWNVGISSWNVGKDTTVFKLAVKDSKGKNINAACVICIESVYPDFVAKFVQKGADFIAVVTNDSWYGRSSGPYQHEMISVLRAVENRRSVVRAANGGISCIIDPLGRIKSETELFTRTQLTGEISINKNITFYTAHPLLIPFISISFTIVIIVLFLVNKLLENFKFKREDRET